MRVRLPRMDAAISPTGHVTGYTWVRAGWSDPALATLTGRVLHDAGRLPMAVAGTLGLPTLDGILLGRHRIIDTELAAAIDAGTVTQVIELASGLSPRGLTFTRRYPDLTYVEADLPGMTRTKRRLLARTGPLAAGHRLATVDAFADHGPTSLTALAEPLDRHAGVAVITEGLLNYFPTAEVTALWARLARLLHGFADGLYLADIFLRPGRSGLLTGLLDAGMRTALQGRVALHFTGSAAASRALEGAGFDDVVVRRVDRWPAASEWASDPGTRRVHVVRAATSAG